MSDNRSLAVEFEALAAAIRQRMPAQLAARGQDIYRKVADLLDAVAAWDRALADPQYGRVDDLEFLRTDIFAKYVEDLDITQILDLGNEIKLDLAGELPDETDPASQPAPDPPIDDRIVEGKWGDPATP
jgi:hypothetical protein